jgi:formylglycine-generating enzyme required for sulfatase activity
MEPTHDWLRSEPPDTGDLTRLLSAAQEREAAGDFRTAAIAYDRAYALDPTNTEVAQARQEVLESLSIREHGLYFRYIPAGTFLMGSESGDPDEQPVHPVELGDYWLTEAPVSWTDYCRLMGWKLPPDGMPHGDVPGKDFDRRIFPHPFADQMRRQYCENETIEAVDPFIHYPENVARFASRLPDEYANGPKRQNPDAPWGWDQKPMIGVGWYDAIVLGETLTTKAITYGLPTEAEWEKAARGGLHNCRYPWGNEPPTADRCDFDRWDPFHIKPSRSLPPNSYGLYGMSGGVWEWTADQYDALYYSESPRLNPLGPDRLEGRKGSSKGLEERSPTSDRVLRGGSWSDPAEVVTVSFRMSRRGGGSPSIGFRLVRRIGHNQQPPEHGGAIRRLLRRK